MHAAMHKTAQIFFSCNTKQATRGRQSNACSRPHAPNPARWRGRPSLGRDSEAAPGWWGHEPHRCAILSPAVRQQ